MRSLICVHQSFRDQRGTALLRGAASQRRSGNPAAISYLFVGAALSQMWNFSVWRIGYVLSSEQWNGTLELMLCTRTPVLLVMLGKSIATTCNLECMNDQWPGRTNEHAQRRMVLHRRARPDETICLNVRSMRWRPLLSIRPLAPPREAPRSRHGIDRLKATTPQAPSQRC